MWRRGVFYSFKSFLPAFAALRGKGGSTLWYLSNKFQPGYMIFFEYLDVLIFSIFKQIFKQIFCLVCCAANGVFNLFCTSTISIWFVLATVKIPSNVNRRGLNLTIRPIRKDVTYIGKGVRKCGDDRYTEYIWGLRRIGGSVSVSQLGRTPQSTALYVMVDRGRGGGRAPPTLTRLG